MILWYPPSRVFTLFSRLSSFLDSFRYCVLLVSTSFYIISVFYSKLLICLMSYTLFSSMFTRMLLNVSFHLF